MRASVIAAAAVAGILAGGCGSVRVSPPPQRSRVTALQRAGQDRATAAGNRAAAQREAARLMALVPVPPGATRLPRPPEALAGPAEGTPLVSSLVDHTMTWRVPLPFAALRAWVVAHPPRGLPGNGPGPTSRGSGGLVMEGYTYNGPVSAAWQQSAQLEIGVAPLGPRASALRADAVLVWLDPRPVPSGPGAHPVRVTLATGCPRGDQGVTGVTNPGAGLTQRLLPPGQPAAGLRCRYDGMNGRPWQLVSAQRLTAAAAREAATSMARLPLSHPDGDVMSCPMADGSAEVLALAYPGRPDIDLWIMLNGCATVSNGFISAAIG